VIPGLIFRAVDLEPGDQQVHQLVVHRCHRPLLLWFPVLASRHSCRSHARSMSGQVSTVEPQVRPPPNAVSTIRSPGRSVPAALRVVHGERNRGGGGVADLGDVADGAVPWDAELVGQPVQDAQVRLVADQPVDVTGPPAGPVEYRPGGLGHALHGTPDTSLPAISKKCSSSPGVTPDSRWYEPPARTVIRSRPVPSLPRSNGPMGARFVGRAGTQHDRAGTVAEDHRRRAVVRVEDAGEGLRADQQYAIGDCRRRSGRPHSPGRRRTRCTTAATSYASDVGEPQPGGDGRCRAGDMAGPAWSSPRSRCLLWTRRPT